ncbi:ATP-binding protein [Streptomyces sp. LaPpAH-108]|uniref:ATP-binding protein n=1 Tax=Streptomyces sp. LaPpAH-108 TaxID=1155714 RepID=UPI00037BBDEE|nr:ATP-binding protein [Streptomyces sp. LaPpAH-108]
MDPITPGAEEHDRAPSRRPPRDSLTAHLVQSAPALVRTTRIVSGDFLLTVNPVDGSEIAPVPPGTPGTGTPRKRSAEERAEAEYAALPPGAEDFEVELLARQELRESLVRLLTRGRSVRLTGAPGAGRTALLDLVAEDCTDVAPDGVVRLTGAHRTADDLLRDLFHTVYDAPHQRPEPDELRALVKEIGAVVVVDDLEFGGASLADLLDSAPECAFLLGATPDIPAPAADLEVEEVELPGLDRKASVEILERTLGRALTEEESNWAGDLWFESEGLPLRFVQAGALLRQREQLRAGAGVVDEYGVFQDVRPAVEAVFGRPVEEDEAEEVPLPSLGEAAAPAPLLASRLSASARATLRFAVALEGEVPHQAHLPALVGDTHADAALAELSACGLVSRAGARYRLATSVRTQLEAAGYGDDAAGHALTAARHYAWWAGHPSVAPERVCAEADAVLAALALLAPAVRPRPEGDGEANAEDAEENCAVRLAHAACAAFAAGLHWNAWQRTLRVGAEAARLAGDTAEQAYFHHELGVLALCEGQLDRARTELETSQQLRTALADKRGTVAGRRALALVADRAGDLPALAALTAAEASETRSDPTVPVPVALYGSSGAGTVTMSPAAEDGRPGFRSVARRNLVAAGSGALLVAVLGTVVTLGMTSQQNADRDPAGSVEIDPSATQGLDDGNLGAVPKKDDAKARHTSAPSARSTDPGPDGTLGTADDPTPSAPATTAAADPGETKGTGGGKHSEKPEPKPSRSTSKPPTKPTSKPSGSPKPTRTPTTPPPTETADPTPTETDSDPETSTSASGPASASASPVERGSADPSSSGPGEVI